MRCAALVASLAACAAEHDTDAFVVLPDIANACLVLDAARAGVTIATADGETFAVTSVECRSRLAGQPASGFHVVLPDLGEGYHRATVVIERAAGALLGSRALPFRADRPLLAAFQHADLPGWPVASFVLALPDCIAGSQIHELAYSIRASSAVEPAIVERVGCDTTAARRVALIAERGPLVIEAIARGADRRECARGAAELLASDGAELALRLTGSCR